MKLNLVDDISFKYVKHFSSKMTTMHIGVSH